MKPRKRAQIKLNFILKPPISYDDLMMRASSDYIIAKSGKGSKPFPLIGCYVHSSF
jgi:hypothetical protein